MKFILLWLQEFLIVGKLVVMQMHASHSNAWLCTKGGGLGVITIIIQDFSAPSIIIIAPSILYRIIL